MSRLLYNQEKMYSICLMKVTCAFTGQRAPIIHLTLTAVLAVLWLPLSGDKLQVRPSWVQLSRSFCCTTSQDPSSASRVSPFQPLYWGLGKWTNLLDGMKENGHRWPSRNQRTPWHNVTILRKACVPWVLSDSSRDHSVPKDHFSMCPIINSVPISSDWSGWTCGLSTF